MKNKIKKDTSSVFSSNTKAVFPRRFEISYIVFVMSQRATYLLLIMFLWKEEGRDRETCFSLLAAFFSRSLGIFPFCLFKRSAVAAANGHRRNPDRVDRREGGAKIWSFISLSLIHI